MAFCDNFKELGFLLKFIAMIVNIVALIFWVINDGNSSVPIRGNSGFSQLMLFYHCVPAYTVILIGFVIVYLVEGPPGPWAQRIFGLTGAILFLVFGVIGIINALDKKGSSHELIVAACSFAVGGLLCFDFVKREFL